jgi:hypothetical protein
MFSSVKNSLVHKINIKIKALLNILEVQKNIIELNKLFELKLSALKAINVLSEFNFDKIEVNKCDNFEMCKIVDTKIVKFQSEVNNDKIENQLFKCVWP